MSDNSVHSAFCRHGSISEAIGWLEDTWLELSEEYDKRNEGGGYKDVEIGREHLAAIEIIRGAASIIKQLPHLCPHLMNETELEDEIRAEAAFY